MLNVLKEELPNDQKSSFWTFLSGAVGYAVILRVGLTSNQLGS